jgi:hypothetical protein
MTQIAELTIELAANVARLTEDFGKAKQEVGSALADINAQVTESMKGIGESIDSVNEHIRGMQEAFSAISELAIGGVIGEQILDMGKDFAETAEQIKNTAKMTGMSTDQVQELGHAASMTGASSETMSTGLRKLTMVMTEAKSGSAEAVAAFKNVGISQAELANASPYEVLMKVSNAYANSADNANKSANAQKLFGRSGMELIPMLDQGSAGIEKFGEQAQQLGIVLDSATLEKGEEANQKFKEMGDVMHAAALGIGADLVPAMEKAAEGIIQSATQGGVLNTVMQMVGEVISTVVDIFSQFGQIIVSIGQTVGQIFSTIYSAILSVFGMDSSPITGMQFFRNMLAVIDAAFIALRVVVQESSEEIQTGLTTLGEIAKAIGKVVFDALSGNWSDISKDWNKGMAQVETTVQQSMQRIVTIAKQGGQDISNAVLNALPNAQQQAQTGNQQEQENQKQASIGGDTGQKHGGGQKSKMSQYEEQLADAQVYYAKTHDLRQMSLQQEIDYWKQIVQTQQVSSTDRIAIERKVSDLELEEMKKTATEHQKMAMEQIEAAQKAALSEVAVDEQKAQEMAKRGQISQEQLEQMLEQFENRKYQIEQSAQQQRIALMKGDPNSDPVALQKLLDQLDQITQQHTEKMAELHAQAAKASSSAWQQAFKPITQAFDTTVKGMIMGTTTWQKGLSNIFQSVVSEFLNMGIKMVTTWAANEMTKTSATMSATAVRNTIQQSSDQQGLMSQAMAVIKAIMNDGAKTFSGVWSSLSGIPYVGPALAAAAAPAAMATVVGVTGQVASSAGGDWQIPTDRLNFLHKEETILPRDKASGLDKLMQHFNGQNSANQAPNQADMSSAQQHIHVHANDSQSFHKALTKDPRMLAKAARKALPYMKNNKR